MADTEVKQNAEEWRVVPSEPALSVSSWGRIKINPYEQSMPHGGVKVVRGVPRYGNRSHKGKRRNFIYQRQTYVVGKLVCEAFHGEPPSPYHQHVVRLDRDMENNRPENLRWGTYGETL